LPEAQVDRFMLKILVDYPRHDEELAVVDRSLRAAPDLVQALSLEDLRALQHTVASVYVDPGIVSYAVTLASATRRPSEFGVAGEDDYVAYGASPRGPISLVQAARALALVRGREYAVTDDLVDLAKDALRHRLVLTYQALAENVEPDALLDAVLAAVPVPRSELAPSTAA
jgi:MoxR-like ATPase